MLTQIYNQQQISFPGTGLFLQGLAENSCQEWTALAKKNSLNSFLLKTHTKTMINLMKIFKIVENFA
jgi:hypothetical protein